MMQAQGKDIEQQYNKVSKQNTIGFSVMGACIVAMLFANRAIVRQFEKKNAKDG
jgi:hypothetical protein